MRDREIEQKSSCVTEMKRSTKMKTIAEGDFNDLSSIKIHPTHTSYQNQQQLIQMQTLSKY